MNKSIGTMVMATSLLLGACAPGTGVDEKESQPKGELIGRSDIKLPDGRLTPEALWAMGRIGGASVSPDGKRVVYSVAYYSVAQDKSNRELFVMNADGSDNKQITATPWQESGAVWIKGGEKIAFLCNEGGSNQIWQMNPDGTGREQLSDFDKDIEGFAFSPDEKRVLFIAQVKTVPSTADKYPDLPKATGVVVTDLMYKHWDEWVTTVPHPFVAEFDGKHVGAATDIMEGEPYESPMKPFGGIEQLAWSAGSDKVAYTCRKKTGKAYAISTNSDIYLYDLASKSTSNLTEGNMGYDTNPNYSPDGKYMAWLSMERDGYESDRNRLMVMNVETGERYFASEQFDSNVDSYCWTADGRSLYFTGVWHGESQIYRADLPTDTDGKSCPLTQLTSGVHDYASVALLPEGKLLAQRHSMSMGDELYAIDTAADSASNATQLTFENKHIYDQLEMGRVEERWMATTDGKQMLTWVIYPPHFDPSKKYPTLLFCQGGPQSAVSQFWSYRWNFQIMAAHDYIIVAPNRRGLPGFGSAWNEAISGDYGGQCMRDYLTAIDEVAKEPYVDADRLGCVGASFGGFSVYWLAGHHDKRFKAFIAHDGIFNMEMQYLETEEMWFANWDMGGAYWDRSNATAQRTFANSPHRFVDRWDTPILCIHGERDYRILANQGMAAFNAAVLRGVPAELLLYPDENHWVLKPQNGVLWQRVFFEWLDKWLKKS